MSLRKAVITIVTLEVDGMNYVLLNAVDPRWRLDPEGKSCGIQAIRNGVAQKLPLTNLRFIGGLADNGDTLEQAALRELSEEAGEQLAQLTRQSGLSSVYTMASSLEWAADQGVELTYFHTHVKIGRDVLDRIIEPGDDCLAIALVETDQITRGEKGYFIAGEARKLFWRGKYVPIPFQEKGWKVTEAQRTAYDFYNREGSQQPAIGIDFLSLFKSGIPLFSFPGIDPLASLSKEQIMVGRGPRVANGAIFQQQVMPRLVATASGFSQAARPGF